MFEHLEIARHVPSDLRQCEASSCDRPANYKVEAHGPGRGEVIDLCHRHAGEAVLDLSALLTPQEML